MSEASGPIAVVVDEGHAITSPAGAERSEETQELVDREARRAIGEAYARVSALLAAHRDGLEGGARSSPPRRSRATPPSSAGVADGTAPRPQTGVGAGRSG